MHASLPSLNPELIAGLPRKQKVELLLLLEEKAKREALKTNSVVGFVCPDKGFTHALKRVQGQWQPTEQTPDVYLPAKQERVLLSNKRFIVVIGGRGSTKSVSAGDICLIDARDNGAKTYCLREYQSSIKNSVHSLLKEEIDRLEFKDFEVLQNSIHYKGRDCFEFAGLARNVDSIKSAYGFKRFLVEESQSLSTESLRALTPTARAKPNKGLPKQFRPDEFLNDVQEAVIQDGVSIVFVANPASSQDPFSQRFIVPFLTDLETNGFYEDDLHLIVVMNYTDNPWFAESGLEAERQWDYEHLDRALYDHIWLGKFNDSVESALIKAEWFDACVDAHIKLGFKPKGAKIASHDPSDEGKDTKGYAMRHGAVFLDVQEKKDGNVNEGGHWAADIAIKQGVDAFSWDGGGMGAGLAEQMSADFKGKNVQLSVYNGAFSPDRPEAIYKPAVQSPVAGQKTNEQTFYNTRAQYHWDFRDRVYRTYRAVTHHEYCDPDQLISFSSSIALLSKLRAEACRIPIKPNTNGMNTLYTKEEMRAKFKIPSPNLFDSAVQTLRHIPVTQARPVMPQPIRAIGLSGVRR
jgi:phage terminase large subunit